jgi:hypothetical protein
MLKYETFETHFRKFFEKLKSLDEYLEKIPSDIRDSVFDNTYANGLSTLMWANLELGIPKLSADISWFLYDMPKNDERKECNVTHNGKEYVIYDIETFLSFVKEIYFVNGTYDENTRIN